MLMVDPGAPPSVVQFLARYGVRAGDDLVVDERNRFYGADSFMPRVPIFDEGTFRKNLDTAAVFSVARTVVPMEDEPPGWRVLLLALTSERELGPDRRRHRSRRHAAVPPRDRQARPLAGRRHGHQCASKRWPRRRRRRRELTRSAA